MRHRKNLVILPATLCVIALIASGLLPQSSVFAIAIGVDPLGETINESAEDQPEAVTNAGSSLCPGNSCSVCFAPRVACKL